MLYQLSYLPPHSCTYVTITHASCLVNGLPCRPKHAPASAARDPSGAYMLKKTLTATFSSLARCLKFSRNGGAHMNVTAAAK